MSKTKLILLSLALLSCLVATTQSALAQVATKPAPVPAPTPADIQPRVTGILIEAGIPDDPAVDKMLEAYSPKVRALDEVIGKLKGDLKKGGVGAGSLGNFVADGIRAEASLKLGRPVPLAVTNGGGLRKNVIGEGELRVRDIFELLPFENALVAFDLTGAQVLDLLGVAVSHRNAQSGARVSYRINSEKKIELDTAHLLIAGQEKQIDPSGIYTVISIDYLFKRRAKPSETEGDYSVLREAKNIRPLGLTIRDAIIHYVKTETAAGREVRSVLDGRFVFKKSDAAATEEMPPQ